MALLSRADYAALTAAIADLRAWDARDALKARAGGARVAGRVLLVAGPRRGP